jgi:hypothetical protein
MVMKQGCPLKQRAFAYFYLWKEWGTLQIKYIIADKKPKDCIACPLAKLKQCGKSFSIRGTSGSMTKRTRPDGRCLIREARKT